MLQGGLQISLNEAPVDERRRGAGHTRANAALEVAADALCDLTRAPIGVEPLHVQAQRPGPTPEMRIVDPPLVAIDRNHERPEGGLPSLQRRGLCGGVQSGSARMLAGHREVPEGEANG